MSGEASGDECMAFCSFAVPAASLQYLWHFSTFDVITLCATLVILITFVIFAIWTSIITIKIVATFVFLIFIVCRHFSHRRAWRASRPSLPSITSTPLGRLGFAMLMTLWRWGMILDWINHLHSILGARGWGPFSCIPHVRILTLLPSI